MFRLLIWALLIYIGYRIIASLSSGRKSETAGRTQAPEASATHRDPVCGMYVAENDAVIGRHNGERHYFCSMQCLEKYREQLDHTPS